MPFNLLSKYWTISLIKNLVDENCWLPKIFVTIILVHKNFGTAMHVPKFSSTKISELNLRYYQSMEIGRLYRCSFNTVHFALQACSLVANCTDQAIHSTLYCVSPGFLISEIFIQFIQTM